MDNFDELKQNWYRRDDVFEILHFLQQFENPGISAEEVKELRGKGDIEEINDVLTVLEEMDVVESEGADGNKEYWIKEDVFARLASKRWAEGLSERQEEFINLFARKYLDDRKKGTIRRMITENIVQGIYEKRKDLDTEILELAEKLSLEDEAYSNPGIYAELAIKEME